MPSSPGIGMHVEVKDPEDKTILSRVGLLNFTNYYHALISFFQVYSSEGRFTFTSHTPGEHVICLYSNSTKWFSGTQLVKLTRKNCLTFLTFFDILILEGSFRHPSWRTCHRLCQHCSERKAVRVAAEGETASGPS